MTADGPFILLKVTQIYKRNTGLDWFQLHGHCWRMAVGKLHAFVAMRDGERVVLTADTIQPNDEIWVDRVFVGDGTLQFTAPTLCKKQ